MKSPIFLDPAKQELKSAVDYYDSCSDGLGKQFALEIKKSLSHIARYPHAWTLVRNNVRRYIINRFPYVIIYYLDVNNIIIVAIMNSSQQPEYWINRI